MQNKKAIKKIEKAGFNIEFCLNGFIVASGLINGEYKKYKADTIQGIINLIF